MAEFLPRCAVTGVGSLPFDGEAESVAFVEKYAPEVAFIPDGSRTLLSAPFHGLNAYFVEMSPVRLVLREGALEDFLDSATSLAGGLARVSALSLKLSRGGVRPLKGQIAGPITLLTNVFYNDEPLLLYQEAIAVIGDLLTRRAAAYCEILREASDQTIFVLDEPCLSKALEFPEEERNGLFELVEEILASAREAGALAGIHSCAPLPDAISELRLDVLSFDATMPAQTEKAIGRAPYLSFGLAPTSDASLEPPQHAAEALIEVLRKSGRDPKEILLRSLVTPTCGVGPLSASRAVEVFTYAAAVSAELRRMFSQ